MVTPLALKKPIDTGFLRVCYQESYQVYYQVNLSREKVFNNLQYSILKIDFNNIFLID